MSEPVRPKYKTFNPFRKYLVLTIPEGVARYKGISPGAKLVYGRLYRYAGAKGVAFPKIETLAEEVGLGVRQTQEYVYELRDNDFIFVRRRYHQSAVYEFLQHPSLGGDEGESRMGNPDGVVSKVKPQDAADSLSEVKPQDAADLKTAGCCGLTPPRPLLYEEGHLLRGSRQTIPHEHQIQTEHEPLDPTSLLRILNSRFKRLRGMGSFTKGLRDIVEKQIQSLDPRARETYIIDLFETWSSQDYWKDFQAAHKVRSFFAFVDNQGPEQMPDAEATAAQVESPDPGTCVDTPKTSHEAPRPVALGFPERWNAAVPERPVDTGLLPPRPKAYTDPGFAARFDEICAKARDLIVAGADLQFGFLLGSNRDTGQHRWQELLAGQLEWMKPRAAKAPAAAQAAANAKSMIDRIIERRRQESEAKAKAADKTA